MSNTDEFAKVGLAPRGEQLKGKWALITGASRGVGWTIAEKFASEGANLILVARSADSLEKLAAELKGKAGEIDIIPTDMSDSAAIDDLAKKVLEKLAAELKGKAGEIDIIPTDMSDSAAIDDLAKKVLEKYGGVDILVNNAGILAANGDSPLEGDPDEWDKLFKLNVSAPLRLTRRLAPSLVERKGGAIINTGSMAAVAANPEQCSYVATKHALLGFSISAFEVLRHHGIKVCIINPAYINSSMTSVRTDAYFDKMIYPADVAEAAMLVIRTSFNCCPTQIWLQNNPDIIHHD